MFIIIAIIGKNRELGRKGQLVFNIKRDMDYFKETTTGHTVVMGKNTWKSLPRKLSRRKNVVINYDPIDGADETITDLQEFINKHQNTPEEIFIIGGGMIYQEFLPYADKLYLTEVDESVPDADVFFPVFDKTKYKRKIVEKGDNFQIVHYIKKRRQDERPSI